MWLQAVDHVLVGLQEHAESRRIPLPDEDVAAVAARHDEVVAPEIRLLDHCPKETRVTHERRAKYENIAWADINSPSVHFRGFTFAFDTRGFGRVKGQTNSFQATRRECRSHTVQEPPSAWMFFFLFCVTISYPDGLVLDKRNLVNVTTDTHGPWIQQLHLPVQIWLHWR